jgi:hypothetical protein
LKWSWIIISSVSQTHTGTNSQAWPWAPQQPVT